MHTAECMQDYNEEVLRALTIPTVTANVSRIPASQQPPLTRFLAGSWAAMPAWLRSTGLTNSFDIVLTSETIYSSASSMHLYRTLMQVSQGWQGKVTTPPICVVACMPSSSCVSQALKPGGIALVAAKTHYFGVGGGSLAFRQLVKDQQPQLMVARTVAEVKEGSSVVRDVMELRYASAS